nr:PREDICTED: integrator complex subunit 1 [Equus przewalskii]
MNRAKPTAVRRPSAAAKPSGHPPPGDFIALGSKGQASESKTGSTLLKPAPSGLPSERKRDAAAALAGASALTGLTKRPKLSSTPPLSALGRLAEAAVAEKRAISPSIKEPSVVPIEVPPTVLLDEIEAAELEGNDDRIEGVLCGAAKQLKVTRAKPDSILYLSLMYLAKIKPNIFATEGVIEALCSLLRRDASINFKAKGNSLVSVLACNLLMAAYEEDENWPEIFVKVYIEDSLGERIWVDSPHCKTFVDNVQTAFNTKMPPKSMLLQGEAGRSGGDLSAGNSPHPALTEEEDSQTELLIAEEKLSPEQEGQLMPRYDDLTESVEEYVLDMLRDQLNRRQPIDNVSRNLLRLLTSTSGYKEVRLMTVQKLEMWLQNPKLTRPAQDLLMSVCMNCNTHASEDMDVISHLIKIRLKPKVLLNHYMLCVRELLNAHKDNLGTTIKFVIFNELSNARNPNNMQTLYTVLQHSPERRQFLAMVFQDLLTNKDDYLRASRALLREIIKQTKHEINFQAFCLGLMQERKEPQYLDMEFKERFVVHITDVLAVSMMLGITAQVKEAGIAWDKGEKKNLEVLRSFQNQIAAIQRDAVWWLHTVVPSISKLAPKDYVHCLHKVLFTEQPETYYKWDNWPPESDRNFFLRLCSEVPILEDTLMRILVIGLSRELPLGPADAMELADHLVKRAAAVQADDVEVLKVERIQLIDAVLNLCTYHHPENIQLPAGYQPPNLAISTLYWKAWPLLLVVAAFNPENIGLAAWEEYPTLKMLMEMVMTKFLCRGLELLKRQQKQRQLLGRLQDLLLGPKADEQTTCEVLDYFLRRLGSSQVASRVLAMKGLSLVLSEGSLRDGEEKEPPMEEDSGDSETLQGYQWLLRDLPRLPLFDSVRTTTALALQQAIHMETDPQTISAYLVYLSQHTPVEEQGQHSDLALRSTIMSHLFSKRSYGAESDAVLVALLSIFSRYVRRMRKSKEGEEVYSWSESQDQVFLRWTSGETATMHILVVHAMVILLTLGPPRAGDGEFRALLDIWFPEKKPLPTAFLVDTSEEALLLPDWLKLRMIRSEVPRLVDAALQDLEPQQLLLFVQSFGIPVSSMSKLLQYLDQAVAHDPQTLEQNIMDKNYMAHLVEVQHERGASGGQTFHSLLTASLPPRRDSAEAPKPKSSPEQPPGQGRVRAGTQVRALGPEDDLAGMLLQVFPLSPGPRWQSSSARPVALALQQALGQELAQVRQGSPEVTGIAVRLLQAIATLLNSPHSGALVMSMHRHHFLTCPLMRQLCQYQRSVPQDTGFSSLFLKVLMQILQWLDSPAVEGGPLQSQLKLFAAQYSARRRITDVRSGFLHLAEALTFRGDLEVVNSTVRALVTTLKSGEKCGVEPELVSKVLRGLIEVRSPHLEELLAALFSATSAFAGSRPIVVVSSLLLQDKEEPPAPGKQDADGGSLEAVRLGPCSGLLVDWLEMLDPEVISSCPDLQQRLLFSRSKGKGHPGPQVPSFRPYLLALLTHQSSWSTLHQCIRILLGKHREQRFDPSASLDFLWACIHVPRIWQGRDQRTPQKRREELVLRVQAPELTGLVELILAEAEARSQDGDAAACSLLQARLPLLLSCCHGDDESVRKVTAHLTGCIQQWGDSVLGQRCRDLLVQLYLQRPELRVPVHEVLLHSAGATGSSVCKLDGLIHRFITLLADTSDSRSSENRVADANMACRKLAVAHPLLLLRHLPMVAALLHGRTHLNFQEFRQQSHLAFFLHVLGLLELLQPQVFRSEHQGALWDCLLSFVRLLLNYRKSSRHLAPFISKFVQFTHQYITHNAPAAVSFLQKHSDALHDLSFDSSDLVMLKSLLAGLSLPSGGGRADRGLDEEGDGRPPAVHLDGSSGLGRLSLPLTALASCLADESSGLGACSSESCPVHRRPWSGVAGQREGKPRSSQALRPEVLGALAFPRAAQPGSRPFCLWVLGGCGSAPSPAAVLCPHGPLPLLDLLEVLSDIDEMSRRRPEILGFFSTNLQRLMSSPEESSRNLAFSLALRSIQNSPSIAADFLPTFMYCLGSRDFEVVQTALRNLPEYTLLCQEHAAVLLHRAFLVGMYGQVDTSAQISEALRILHMEAVM